MQDEPDKCLLCNHANYGLKMSELEGHNRKVSPHQIWSNDALQITPCRFIQGETVREIANSGTADHSGVCIKNPDILKHFVI